MVEEGEETLAEVTNARAVAVWVGPYELAAQRVIGKTQMPLRWNHLFLALQVLCVLPLSAQERNCTLRTDSVNVVSGDEKILEGLQTSVFQASFRGMQVKIRSTTWDEHVRRELVLLDSSGSMTMPETKRGMALNVADQLVDQMPPETQIGLGVFSVTLGRTVHFSTDRQELRRELMEIAADQNPSSQGKYLTAVRDAILESLKLFGDPQEGDVLYIISDGKDNASHFNSAKLRDAVLSAGVRVFALGPENLPDPRCSTGAQDCKVLPSLVEATGGYTVTAGRKDGTVYFPSRDFLTDKSGKPTQLAQDLARQFRQMTAYLRMELEFPQPVYGPATWELKLTNRSEMKATELIYPHMLPPCSSNSRATNPN
jgi:hypothetical protein